MPRPGTKTALHETELHAVLEGRAAHVSSPGSPVGTGRHRQASLRVVASWAVITRARGRPRGMQTAAGDQLAAGDGRCGQTAVFGV